MTSTIRRTFGATIATAALVLGAAGTATAQSVALDDNPNDAHGSSHDIAWVKVEHTKKYVVIVTDFGHLEPSVSGNAPGLSMFVDLTDAKGPELRLSTGLDVEGSDYQLVAMYENQPVGDPLSCGHMVKISSDGEMVRAKIDRECTGEAAKVRVAVKLTDHLENGDVVTDWLKKKKYYTKWLASA